MGTHRYSGGAICLDVDRFAEGVQWLSGHGEISPAIKRRVSRLLRRLPPRQRHIVRRVYLEGAAQWRVGKELSISQVSVCQGLAVALEHMRRWGSLPADPDGDEVEHEISKHYDERTAAVVGTYWEVVNESETGRRVGCGQSTVYKLLTRVELDVLSYPAKPLYRHIQDGIGILRSGPPLYWHATPSARALAAARR